jgi:aspartate aminotransferase-like enzyme
MVMPESIDADALRKELTGSFNITVAGGQGDLMGRIIRVAHLGYCGESDVVAVISALEMVLNRLGHECKPGAGVAAAEKVFSQQND